MKNNNYHVYKKNDKWTVKGTSAKRAVKSFDNKSTAVSAAVSLAKKKQTNVIVHKKDMKVSRMYKYGEKRK